MVRVGCAIEPVVVIPCVLLCGIVNSILLGYAYKWFLCLRWILMCEKQSFLPSQLLCRIGNLFLHSNDMESQLWKYSELLKRFVHDCYLY